VKKILAVSIFLFLGAFSPSFASTLGQTSDHSTNLLTSAPGQHIHVFTPDANQTFNQITVWNDGTYGGTQTIQLLSAAGAVLKTGTTTGAVAGATTFTFTDTTLTAGTKYAFRPITMYLMGAPSGGASDLEPKGCKEYAYTLGNALGTCGAGNTQTKADIYLSVNNAYTAPSIDFTFPVNGQSYADDFSHWQLALNSGSAGFSGYWGVRYGNSTSTMTNQDDTSVFGVSLSANSTSTQYIQKGGALGGYTYAQAFIANISGVDIATSTTIYFGANGFTSPTRYTGTPIAGGAPASTSTDLIITCDETDGLFQNSMCKLLVYLFKPSDGSFNVWANLWTTISRKPPFGYFTRSKEALEGINTSTSSAFVFEDMEALATPVFTPLRNGVAMLLWFLFGVWGFTRLKHLQF